MLQNNKCKPTWNLGCVKTSAINAFFVGVSGLRTLHNYKFNNFTNTMLPLRKNMISNLLNNFIEFLVIESKHANNIVVQ